MRRKQDAALAALHHTAKELHELVARHGVEPARRLIENEQTRIVREREREHIFHAHTGRELRDLLRLVEREQRQVVPVFVLVPAVVKRARHVRDAAQLFIRVKVHAAEHHAELLLAGGLVGIKIPAEHRHAAAVRTHEVEHGLDGRALAGTVAADEAHDRARLNGKRHIAQPKRRIRLAQTLHFQNAHCPSSRFSSCASAAANTCVSASGTSGAAAFAP